jgi:hypothetical protein
MVQAQQHFQRKDGAITRLPTSVSVSVQDDITKARCQVPIRSLLGASSVSAAFKPDIPWHLNRSVWLAQIEAPFQQLPSQFSHESQQCDFKRHQRERADLLLEEENKSINQRLSGTIENAIDQTFRFLYAPFMGCVIESPGIKIIHGGVLAMRGCLFPKLPSQRTPLFQIPI